MCKLFKITGLKDGWFIPLVYVLACDQQARTYEIIFLKLVELMPTLRPEHITLDFEQAAIKALKKLFTDAQIHGCNFHFAQNIWRHIQQAGLQVKYSEDADFALNMRYILALPYVPIENVEHAFTAIASTDFFSDDEKKKMRIWRFKRS